MKAEELIKNNALSTKDLPYVVNQDGKDQEIVSKEIALTAINMARIEAYNQAIGDAAECVCDDEIVPIDYHDYSAGYQTVPNEGKSDILKLKK